MKINCPNCHAVLDLIEEPGLGTCPSCGSQWDDPTTPFSKQTLDKISRFGLLERLGAGSYGTVWRAQDPLLGREVAVKIPREYLSDQQESERFLHEARAAAKLSHPNIIPVHEVGIHEGNPFIVSEFVPGTTLAQLIRQRNDEGNGIKPREAAEISLTIARAIQHAHECGIVHRDLKPTNIMLDAKGVPRIADFGLAKLSRGDFTITAEGQVVGTMRYMSPEQARGESHQTDGRSDVYSIGIILYEMIGGRPPFQGDHGVLQHRILHEEPESLSRHLQRSSKDLETICLQAIAKDPSRRYQSAGELADDLQRFLDGTPTLARPIGPLERNWRRVKQKPLGVVAAGLAICCIALVAMLSLPSPDTDPRQRVLITSTPAGADVVVAPIRLDGSPDETASTTATKKTPCELKLPPGFYLIELGIEGHGFQSAYRTVPISDADESHIGYRPQYDWTRLPDGTVQLPKVNIPNLANVTEEMILVEGGEFEEFEAGPIPQSKTISIDAFYVDPTEVSVKSYVSVMGNLPHGFEEAGADPNESLPIAFVSFDQAIHYAEKVGKRLIRDGEFHFVATNAGTTIFPWGNEPLSSDIWTLRPVEEDSNDRSQHATPVRNLFSNVAEWTDGIILPRLPPVIGDSPLDPEVAKKAREAAENLRAIAASSRTVRGGPNTLIDDQSVAPEDWGAGAKLRFAYFKDRSFRHVGFRCARDAQPRLLWKKRRAGRAE